MGPCSIGTSRHQRYADRDDSGISQAGNILPDYHSGEERIRFVWNPRLEMIILNEIAGFVSAIYFFAFGREGVAPAAVLVAELTEGDTDGAVGFG